MWRVLPDKPDGLPDAVALAVTRKIIIECHAIEFYKLVPFRALNKPDQLRLIHRRPERHDAMKLAVQECAEMKGGVVDNFPAVMMGSDEWVSDGCGNNLDDYFLSSAHSFTSL